MLASGAATCCRKRVACWRALNEFMVRFDASSVVSLCARAEKAQEIRVIFHQLKVCKLGNHEAQGAGKYRLVCATAHVHVCSVA